MLWVSLDGREVWGRMDTCIYGWVPSLSTWNYHNIVNWLHTNINQKVKKDLVCHQQCGKSPLASMDFSAEENRLGLSERPFLYFLLWLALFLIEESSKHLLDGPVQAPSILRAKRESPGRLSTSYSFRTWSLRTPGFQCGSPALSHAWRAWTHRLRSIILQCSLGERAPSVERKSRRNCFSNNLHSTLSV